MEKNKKVLKNYVMCSGGGRGGLDEVEEVVSEMSIEEYLEDLGKDSIESVLEECRDEDEREGMLGWIEEFNFGSVEKCESSKGFEVYMLGMGEEECVWMFEGKIDDVEEIVSLDELYDYLGLS
jgi:hypothetical protein